MKAMRFVGGRSRKAVLWLGCCRLTWAEGANLAKGSFGGYGSCWAVMRREAGRSRFRPGGRLVTAEVEVLLLKQTGIFVLETINTR